MSIIFISGSRQVRRLADPFRLRLANVLATGHPVVVGDADGAVAAVQAWCREQGYDRLTVFCSGTVPRNNIGRWPVRRVAAAGAVFGFAFHAIKDRAMAEVADYGLMIWDGTSPGTILNALRLIQADKTSALFDTAAGQTVTIRSVEDWRRLVASRGSFVEPPSGSAPPRRNGRRSPDRISLLPLNPETQGSAFPALRAGASPVLQFRCAAPFRGRGRRYAS